MCSGLLPGNWWMKPQQVRVTGQGPLQLLAAPCPTPSSWLAHAFLPPPVPGSPRWSRRTVELWLWMTGRVGLVGRSQEESWVAHPSPAVPGFPANGPGLVLVGVTRQPSATAWRLAEVPSLTDHNVFPGLLQGRCGVFLRGHLQPLLCPWNTVLSLLRG